jgi:hypothetical protein
MRNWSFQDLEGNNEVVMNTATRFCRGSSQVGGAPTNWRRLGVVSRTDNGAHVTVHVKHVCSYTF